MIRKTRTIAMIAVPSAAVALIISSIRARAAGCIPKWQCEPGNTGYQIDGCGNRRPNPACLPGVPPPLGIAYPELKDATAYSTGSTTTAMWLFTNKGGYGYSKFAVYQAGQGNILGEARGCFDVRTGLKYLSSVDIYNQTFNFFDLIASKCATVAEETCPAATCTNEMQTSSILGIAVKQYDYREPGVPPNLIITPGDGTIDISWCAASNAEIFAYYLEISHAGNVLVSGYTRAEERLVTVGGLTNGVEYGISVRALSHSGIEGSTSQGTAIPGA